VRVGLGYDAHRLVAGRPLVIGGVELDSKVGLLGHSDADVLSHAIVDALLGAAGLGTIGELFPDDDSRFEGISSLELVAAAAARLREAGFHVVNVDTVVVAERPRLQPHLAEMARRLAGRLGLDTSQVSVKATSPEGLGALGRTEGIAAQAIALIDNS
jgi:2-C-methyl-D-erythritol 2,4-cyclodiphosphate synthase